MYLEKAEVRSKRFLSILHKSMQNLIKLQYRKAYLVAICGQVCATDTCDG